MNFLSKVVSGTSRVQQAPLKMGDGGEMEGRLASKKMLARYTAMLEVTVDSWQISPPLASSSRVLPQVASSSARRVSGDREMPAAG